MFIGEALQTLDPGPATAHAQCRDLIRPLMEHIQS